MSKTKPITAISLFAGCGGSDFALAKSGRTVIWANEIWGVACRTYEDNIPNANIHEGDIRDFEVFPSAELLVGCYPCQGYSQGGKREKAASINYLYREFDRVLRHTMPKAFIVENVNGMAYGGNHKLLMNQIYRFRLAGYRVKWSVLDAKDHGLAQTRRRVFLVGIRSDLDFVYSFPSPTHGPNGSQPYVSQERVIGSMPIWPDGEFNSEPFHWYYLSRRRRSTWGKPSPCIVAHWRHVPLHPSSPPLKRVGADAWEFARAGRPRRFSYLECAALQGLQHFRWKHGQLRDRFRLIGNAVPPPFFDAVLQPLTVLWSSE